MENKTVIYADRIFEKIKHIDEYGNEYWYTRNFQKY